MLKSAESTQNLLANIAEGVLTPGVSVSQIDPVEKPLGPVEKTFLLHAERGDCATVRRLIHEYKNNPAELDINCVDPLNRSALIAAIENENIELMRLLLDEKIKVKDGLLHAIKEEYVEAVELLLQYEEQHHVDGEPYSWEAVDRSSSTFTSDITPLILAAHKNNYEIIKILLDRGATLPMPHDVRCGCDECVESSSADSLRHSQARINAYRALTASSLIALSSKDPLLTAFELSWELRRLSRMEQEFRAEYNEMRNLVQTFATALLDHARTSYELEIMLNYEPESMETWDPGERQSLERLKLALKYKQKNFVAHPSVQQLLAAIWYEGLPGFRRKSAIGQVLQVAKLGAMFPVYCTIYMLAPDCEMGKFMKKPFVKFICHSSSYALFLMLLGAASQRVEILALEWFGNDWMQQVVAEWKHKERGAGPGLAECGVILYMISLIWGEIRALWNDGLLEYISDLWNVVDFITNMFYVLWLAMRCSSFYIVWREASQGRDPWYPREQWHMFDPMLLSEGAFAAGMIFSFLKLVHIFSINPHMGPLQISLGRMIIDIVKFFFIYTLVLFAFGCGLNQLLWYYAELEKHKCYHLPSGLPDFDNNDKACTIWRRYANLFETSQSLFWASFGLVDLVSFELSGIKGFTRFWALLMFGSYSVINVIVLLNMLIAMMSNSYQIISERSDKEWKFARSKLWISYFDDGDTVPPPFNIFPNSKMLLRPLGLMKKPQRSHSFKRKTREIAINRHQRVMRLLVRRYVTAEQRKRDDFGITEDDVMEIRQDISTLRYELIDILRNNGMKTPQVSSDASALSGKKGKVMERRLLKDFHIGIVEAAVTEAVTNLKEPKDIFGTLARVIGKRSSNKSSKKKDWNALVRSNTTHRDPIGSSQEAENSRANRQSLRRHILSHIRTPVQMDQDKLLEYNPKLVEVPKTARVAYAKFMTKKIQSDYTVENEIEKTEAENEPTKTTRKSSKRPAPKPSVKFRGDDTASTTGSDGGGGGGGSTPRRVDTESKITASTDSPSSSISPKPATIDTDGKRSTASLVKRDAQKEKEIIMDQPIRDANELMKATMTPTPTGTAAIAPSAQSPSEGKKSGQVDGKCDVVKDDINKTLKDDENTSKDSSKDIQDAGQKSEDDNHLKETEKSGNKQKEGVEEKDEKQQTKKEDTKPLKSEPITSSEDKSQSSSSSSQPTGLSKLSGKVRTGWI